MTKMSPNNGNESKSDILQGAFSTMASYISLIKKYYIISITFNIEIFQFYMTDVNPSNGNDTKSDTFAGDIFKSGIIFHWSQNTKIFQ